MTHFYAITCSSDQAIITDKLKSGGADVIQSSSGLVCKSERSLEELKRLLGNANFQIESLNNGSNQSLDVQKFLSQS